MNQTMKILLIVGGSVAAATAAIVTGAAIWNNRQLRMLRSYHKTGKIIGRTATILQSISQAME